MDTPQVNTAKTKNRFIGAKIKKNVTFMEQDLEIKKLTVSQVLQIQEKAKAVKDDTSEAANLDLLVFVIKAGAEELSDLTLEEFKEFPMEELTSLSGSIMEYSGLATQPVAKTDAE